MTVIGFKMSLTLRKSTTNLVFPVCFFLMRKIGLLNVVSSLYSINPISSISKICLSISAASSLLNGIA